MTANTDATKVTDGEIGVRMYNVGFGDCFLIFIPTPKGLRKMLIDCGSMASAKLAIDAIADQVIVDAAGPDGKPVIDVVVATHRHRDHVSGFAAPSWRQVRVREVWMPWTEDPRDTGARKLRDGQTAFASGLHLAARDAHPSIAAAAKQVRDDPLADASALLAIAQGKGPRAAPALQTFLALNALSNPEAMATLHDGFAGKPARWFLPEGGKTAKRARTFRSNALPGVKISILGPSRDPAVVRKLNPPKKQRYFQLAATEAGGRKAKPAIADDWKVLAKSTLLKNLKLTDKERDALHKAAEGEADALAAAADSKLNGTSLVIVLEIDGVHLLLAGDAQWGTWEAAIADEEWGDLLQKTKFFKVGHHGSHNASPKSLVEGLLGKRGDVLAMVSTRTFGSWDIPRGPLLDQLKAQRVKIARSDKNASAPFIARTHWTDVIIPTR